MWKFKDGNCLGVYDDVRASDMTVPRKYGQPDNYFEIHGSKGTIHVTRCTGEMLDPPLVILVDGSGTVGFDVASDWTEGFNAAADDFVSSILLDRQPHLDARFSKKTIQVALAIYEGSRSHHPI